MERTSAYIHTRRPMHNINGTRDISCHKSHTCLTIKLSKYTTVITYTDSLAVSYEIYTLC